jgi:hypothetical protein
MPQVEQLGRVRFRDLGDGADVSGVALWNGRALVVTDERLKVAPPGGQPAAGPQKRNALQVLMPDGPDFRRAPDGLLLLDDLPQKGGNPAEMDLEGLAVSGNTVYVLGSHSWRRKAVDAEANTVAANRALLLGSPEPQPGRDVLLRVELDAQGRLRKQQATSLRPLLDQTEPFASFSRTASKENGVDAEGLAIWKQNLYIGFRGPVLRGNYTPILKLRFGPPVQKSETLFVNLGGLGIRDLAHTTAGLLILAGPVGDGPGNFPLYFWNGQDDVPGINRRPGARRLQYLGDAPVPAAEGRVAKPEGLALVRETAGHWELLLVYDGLKNGHGLRLRVKRPK